MLWADLVNTPDTPDFPHEDRMHFIGPSGKVWPLRERKLQALALVAAMARAGGFFDQWVDKVRHCANLIDTLDWVDGELHYKTVASGFRCKYVLCPVCWLLQSRKRQFELFATYQRHAQAHPHDVAVLLTPTFPNAGHRDFPSAVTRLFDGHRRMTRSKPFQRAVRGWYRTCEAVYNPRRDDFNLHAHYFLLMRPNYGPGAEIWLDHGAWLKIWRRSMRMPDIKVLHVNRITNRGEQPAGDPAEAGIAEVTKYLCKGSSIFSRTTHGFAADPKVIRTLHEGFFNRRLRAMGGSLKAFAEDIDFSALERAPTAEKTGEETFMWTTHEALKPGDYLVQNDLDEASPNGN
ncbi:MAG: protein rep [Filomicrobium sp.]